MVMLAGPSPEFISFVNSHLAYVNYFFLFSYIFCFIVLFNNKTKLTLLVLSVVPSLLTSILFYFYYQSNENSLKETILYNILMVLCASIFLLSTTIGDKKEKK